MYATTIELDKIFSKRNGQVSQDNWEKSAI